MKKKDLKSGMIVMLNNGFYYMVLLNTGMNYGEYTDKDILLGISSSGSVDQCGWMGLSSYNDNLEADDEDFTIFEVYSANRAADIGRIKNYKSIWRRE